MEHCLNTLGPRMTVVHIHWNSGLQGRVNVPHTGSCGQGPEEHGFCPSWVISLQEAETFTCFFVYLFSCRFTCLSVGAKRASNHSTNCAHTQTHTRADAQYFLILCRLIPVLGPCTPTVVTLQVHKSLRINPFFSKYYWSLAVFQPSRKNK